MKSALNFQAWLILVVICLTSGCGTPFSTTSSTSIGVENRSGKDVTNVRVLIGGRTCAIGIVGNTFLAIYHDFPHENTAHAELMWDWPDGKTNRQEFDITKYRKGNLARFFIEPNQAKLVIEDFSRNRK